MIGTNAVSGAGRLAARLVVDGMRGNGARSPQRPDVREVGEAAAVVLELPALQALAGSLDLFELRLRACDGAVQIWETLLSRYAHSVLRPLVLYRLGWAYRNTISPGFPRDDPAQPHRQLIEGQPASSLSGFAREALRVPYKSPGTATSWSILPGAGQLYAGEVGSGLMEHNERNERDFEAAFPKAS